MNTNGDKLEALTALRTSLIKNCEILGKSKPIKPDDATNNHFWITWQGQTW